MVLLSDPDIDDNIDKFLKFVIATHLPAISAPSPILPTKDDLINYILKS